MGRSWTLGWVGLGAAIALIAGGCNDDQTQPESVLAIEKAPTKTGDNQVGSPSAPLSSPLRVLVTRDGAPAEEVSVGWSAANEGSMAAATSTTDANGIATMTWTLGPAEGTQTASASVVGATNSPITFTATAVSDGGGPPPEAVIVSVEGPPTFQFSPATIAITVGQTVSWTWAKGAVGHNVTPDAPAEIPPGEAGLFDAPHTYSYTFTQPGTYHYHCSNHAGVMSGTVVVAAAQ